MAAPAFPLPPIDLATVRMCARCGEMVGLLSISKGGERYVELVHRPDGEVVALPDGGRGVYLADIEPHQRSAFEERRFKLHAQICEARGLHVVMEGAARLGDDDRPDEVERERIRNRNLYFDRRRNG